MLFGGTEKGKERYLTIIMNQMVPKLYDKYEYTLYDTLNSWIPSGQSADDDTLLRALKHFREEVLAELLEAVDKEYEGTSDTISAMMDAICGDGPECGDDADAADETADVEAMGLDAGKIHDLGPDIDSVYLMLVNAILLDGWDGSECPEGREDFYESFKYNMEYFAGLEDKAISTSMQLLIEDGIVKK